MMPRNTAKIAPRSKIQLYGISMYVYLDEVDNDN